MKYLAFDGINNEKEIFDTIEEAREWLEESFLLDDEGYHPDMKSCQIYKLCESVDYDVVAKKEDFTEEDWEEEYPGGFEEIWRHKFVNTTPEENKSDKSGVRNMRSLGIVDTIGSLKEKINKYPNETSFGFRNQPMQELHEVIYDDQTFVVFQEIITPEEKEDDKHNTNALLRELIMRGNYCPPMTEQDEIWFEEGTDHKKCKGFMFKVFEFIDNNMEG